MINQKEKLQLLEKLMWRINFHRSISMNEKSVFACLALIDKWVGAHSDGNGERSEKDQKANIQAAYEALRNLP
jgi:hypothetical protein